MLAKLRFYIFASGRTGLERHECDERRAFDLIRSAYDSGFGNALVGNQCTLYFHRADTVPADIDDVVNASHDPEISVFILSSSVAGKITAGEFGKILFLKSLRIFINAAQHPGPGLFNE